MTDRADWLAARRSGMGSSDVARLILGGAWHVFAEKLDLVTDDDNEVMKRGRRAEAVVIALAAEEWGWDLRPAGNVIERHAEHGHHCATIDAWLFPGSGLAEPVEIKTAHAYVAGWAGGTGDDDEAGDDTVPEYPRIQTQWQLHVTDRPAGWIVALDGHWRLRRWRVTRDEALIALLIERADAFWHDHVLPQIPPPPDASDDCTDGLTALHPEARDEAPMSLPDEVEALCQERERAKADEDEAKARWTTASNAIRSLMGDAAVGRAGPYTVRWGNRAGRETIDGQRLRAEFPEVAAAVISKGVPGRALTVHKSKTKEG